MTNQVQKNCTRRKKETNTLAYGLKIEANNFKNQPDDFTHYSDARLPTPRPTRSHREKIKKQKRRADSSRPIEKRNKFTEALKKKSILASRLIAL